MSVCDWFEKNMLTNIYTLDERSKKFASKNQSIGLKLKEVLNKCLSFIMIALKLCSL